MKIKLACTLALIFTTLLLIFNSCKKDDPGPTNKSNIWLEDKRFTDTGGNETEIHGFTNGHVEGQTVWAMDNYSLFEKVGPFGEEAISVRGTFFFKRPLIKLPLNHSKYLFEVGSTATGGCGSKSFISFSRRYDWLQVFAGQFNLSEIDPENPCGNFQSIHYSKGESIKANGRFLMIPNGTDITVFKFTEKWIGTFLNGFDVAIISRANVADFDRLEVIDGYFFVSGENQTYRLDTLGNVTKVFDKSLAVFKKDDKYQGLTMGTSSSGEYTSSDNGLSWDHVTDHANFRADSIQFSMVDEQIIAYKPNGIYIYSEKTGTPDFSPLMTEGILPTEDISSLQEADGVSVFITTFPTKVQPSSHCYYKKIEHFFEID